MITLKVKSKGHLIEIPGVAPFRTPADIDVSKANIRDVIGHLKVCGIDDYEIIAKSDSGEIEVYKKEDFEFPKKDKEKNPEKTYKKEIDKRFNRLEKMISRLAGNKTGNNGPEKEQINDKLEKLEKLTQRILDEAVVKEIVYTKSIAEDKKADNIEELEDAFIPDVDISDMTLSSGSSKTLKQDSDNLDDAANLLSGLEKEAK